MPYRQQLSRKYPGFFVILLDQSESMKETDSITGQSKAAIVTRQVNLTLKKMIDSSRYDEMTGLLWNYAYVCVLGYNNTTYPLLHSGEIVGLDTLELNPLGIFKDTVRVYDEQGRFEKIETEEHLSWIRPESQGNTEMAAAFLKVEEVIMKWLDMKQAVNQAPRHECFPPVVIHITDAKNNGKDDPRPVVERIRRLHTNDGNVLVYNCHINHESGESRIFPDDVQQLRDLRGLGPEKLRLAERMFEISSIIPEELRQRAEQIMATPIQRGARCLTYNAEPDSLIKFLRWGTLEKFT